VLEDDRVAEVYLERPERRSIAGNIYLGTVDNVLPGMEAAFIEIGLEKNGFLYVDEIVTPELEGKRHGRKIQDLISRGQTIMVQAVKDPMKTKGARLSMQLSIAGRYLVYVPQGEGIGVSRRLEDAERDRLRKRAAKLDLAGGGAIIRTAARGAKKEDFEREIKYLHKLYEVLQKRAEETPAPAMVFQEADLPVRVVRDIFSAEFDRPRTASANTPPVAIGTRRSSLRLPMPRSSSNADQVSPATPESSSASTGAACEMRCETVSSRCAPRGAAAAASASPIGSKRSLASCSQ